MFYCFYVWIIRTGTTRKTKKKQAFRHIFFLISLPTQQFIVRIKDRKIRELNNPVATSKCQPQFFQGPAIIWVLPASFSQSSSCGICSGKYDHGTNPSLSSSFLSCHLSHHNWYNYVSYGVWMIDLLETRSYWKNIFKGVDLTLITLQVFN